MTGSTVVGRHGYRLFFKLSWAFGLVSFSVVGVLMCRTGEVVVAYGSIIFWAAVLLLIPLVLKYFTYSLTIDEQKVVVEYYRAKIVVPLEEISSVNVRTLNGGFEATHVRDNAGNRISFENGLEDYEAVKQFFLRLTYIARQ